MVVLSLAWRASDGINIDRRLGTCLIPLNIARVSLALWRTACVFCVVVFLVPPLNAQTLSTAEVATHLNNSYADATIDQTEPGLRVSYNGNVHAFEKVDALTVEDHRDWQVSHLVDSFVNLQISGAPLDYQGGALGPGYQIDLRFFEALYGACELEKNTDDFYQEVAWFGNEADRKIRFAKVHGAADSLARVAEELGQLPSHFQDFLLPLERVPGCQADHSHLGRPGLFRFGIALRLNSHFRDYWRWSKPDDQGAYPFKNSIPLEIVAAFERHGFIWGGRWKRYDTTYFEYRPEIVVSGSNRSN
ncbi:MAG: M15 family metallopeptidase [Filomicrobium sp.]